MINYTNDNKKEIFSETDYPLLIENMLDGYACCKMIFNILGQPVDWIYVKVNKKFEELVGIKDIEGKKASDAIPGIKESNQELFDLYGKAAKNGKAGKIETYVAPLKKWFSVSVYSPKKGYFAAVFNVITEEKEREKKLQDINKLLKDVMDNCPSPIFLKDLDGKFLAINSALEKMLGMSNEEIKGKTDYDIADKKIADYWRDNDKKVIASGEAIQTEESADFKDGRHIFLANKFPLKDADGKLYGVGAISHDITEHKNAEEALKERTEELEKMNKIMVGREVRMDEMKKEMAELIKKCEEEK